MPIPSFATQSVRPLHARPVAESIQVNDCSAHPDANAERQTSGMTRSGEYQQLFDKALQDPYVPKDRERMDLRGRCVIPGYSRMRSLW